MMSAAEYANLRPPDRARVSEPIPKKPGKHPPEIELQARWFSGEFGRDFRGTAGERVKIVQFGVWNREAGPDFAEAAVSIDDGEPVRGCIELDYDVRDWERHGHAGNAHYENVILHVFFQSGPAESFTRTRSNRGVVQVLLDLWNGETEAPLFLPAAKLGRCHAPLRALSRETVSRILHGAAQFRMQRKGARLMKLREAHGGDQGLYQAIATTLGYKANRLAFTLLAQRLPLRLLRESGEDAAALLYGVAGFLNEPDLSLYPSDTRSYVRALWERWWARRSEFQGFILGKGVWNLAGIRPVNHPQRRLAALAGIVADWNAFGALAAECDPGKLRKFLTGLRDSYWERHYTLISEAAQAPMALVGESRITEMLANVFYPLAILSDPQKWESYRALRAVLSNRPLATAALRLFGDDPMKKEQLQSVAGQQGLLQIYEDFCMRDDSDCERCLFPRQVAQWR